MTRKSLLPVVKSARDLMRLATKTASCHDCRHMKQREATSSMTCGAHGGRYTDSVNPRGTCMHWSALSPRPSARMRLWTRLGVVALVVAGLLALFAVILAPEDGRCLDYAMPRPQGAVVADCNHPDHEIDLHDDLVLCRCASGTQEEG